MKSSAGLVNRKGEERRYENRKWDMAGGWVLIIYAFLAYFVSSAVGSSMNAASGILAELRGWNATMLTSLISLGAVANIAAGAGIRPSGSAVLC